jgi:hypothetical protein
VAGVRFDQRLREAAAPAEPGAAADRRELGWQLAGWAASGLFVVLVVLVVGSSLPPPAEVRQIGPVRVETAAARPDPGSPGWTVRLRQTPVERFHHGERVWAYGCDRPGCRDADTHLGDFPEDFLAAVRREGSGRVSAGPYRGRYLVRASAEGFRVEPGPRDLKGRPLRAWRTATGPLPVGTAFRVLGCGAGTLCRRVRATGWTVAERSGRTDTVQLYAGDRTGPPPAALRGAVLRIGRS